MDASELKFTTWGHEPEHFDVRAQRQYNALLRRMVVLGEWAVVLLTLAVVICFTAFLFFGNFENIIFTDGTSLSCILDGNTGEIVNVK